MQERLEQTPYLTALIVDTIKAMEAKELGTPSAVVKSQHTKSLSMMMARIMKGSYESYRTTTNFIGLVSGSHVNNMLNSSNSSPGSQPQQGRRAWHAFRALGYDQPTVPPGGNVVAISVDAMSFLPGLSLKGNARDLLGCDNLSGKSEAELRQMSRIVQPSTASNADDDDDEELGHLYGSATMASHMQQTIIQGLAEGVKFTFPSCFEFTTGNPDPVAFAYFILSGMWMNYDVGFLPRALPMDSGSENVTLRQVLATQRTREMLLEVCGCDSIEDLFPEGAELPKGLPLIAKAPWDPVEFFVPDERHHQHRPDEGAVAGSSFFNFFTRTRTRTGSRLAAGFLYSYCIFSCECRTGKGVLVRHIILIICSTTATATF